MLAASSSMPSLRPVRRTFLGQAISFDSGINSIFMGQSPLGLRCQRSAALHLCPSARPGGARGKQNRCSLGAGAGSRATEPRLRLFCLAARRGTASPSLVKNKVTPHRRRHKKDWPRRRPQDTFARGIGTGRPRRSAARGGALRAWSRYAGRARRLLIKRLTLWMTPAFVTGVYLIHDTKQYVHCHSRGGLEMLYRAPSNILPRSSCLVSKS